jgi:CelD/BcsL family acetyltransferase involved in cellulose biosynthesis
MLTIDAVPAAFAFDLEAGDLRYAIANSYDAAFARHSPGKLLGYRHLSAALARGVARVDWGAGDSGYKQVIGARRGPAIRDWLLLRPGLPAHAGRAMRGWWRRSGNPRWTDPADSA